MFTHADPEMMALLHEHAQNNAKPQSKTTELALLNLAFRSFFLLAVLCSIVGMLLWALWLNGKANLSGEISPIVFHTHEMIFGFGATVAVGFLLTAVQTWTGKSSLQGSALIPLIILWLGVRVNLYINNDSSILVAILLQALWWTIAIIAFTKLVVSTKNTRNLMLAPLMAVLMSLNISMLILDATGHSDISLHLARTAVFMFCVLMSIIGGRVIPLFTKSGANLTDIQSPQFLSATSLAATMLCAILFFVERFVELPTVSPLFMLAAGLLHLCRLAYWRSIKTLGTPLLWSLHLSYFFVGFGLGLIGISSYSTTIPFGDSLHVLTLGAMGLMIFAMMSRVSLGHTGRKLEPGRLSTLLFILLALATMIRFLMPVFAQHLNGWNLSAALWISASAIFLWVYTPILVSPRL